MRSSANRYHGFIRHFAALLTLGLLISLNGCETNNFMNPGEPDVLSRDQKPLVVPILDTLGGGIEEPDSAYSNATEVTPADLQPEVTDYQIGPGDLLSVSVFDLLGEGTGETVKNVRVSETGTISLPFISPPLKATGYSEHELETVISRSYEEAKLIRNARVTVAVSEGHHRTFSVQGNVTQPGEYQIVRTDYRMLDALVTARGPTAVVGVEYAYVIRKLASEPGKNVAPNVPAPNTPAQENNAPTTGPDLLLPPTTGPSTQSSLGTSAQNKVLASAAPTSSANSASIFKFDDLQNPSDVRVIRVPINRLRQYGELKYNIVIRPGDMIIIPDPQTGVYYMGGHVLHPGVYGLNGTKVDLEQAWISASGPDDFAVPGRTELIRRIGDNKEVYVRIDYAKIWAGKEPDIYLKPNDKVQVGTDIIAPFLAAFRNSFRFTYGFGFLYDRNFYNAGNGNNSGF